MYDLGKFKLSDMIECGSAIRSKGDGAASTEEIAGKVVRFLYDQFRDAATGQPGFALVRLYETHPFASLEPELKEFARSMMAGQPIADETRCLTLLGTAGDLPEWNERRRSRGHQAIPLSSSQAIESYPMVANFLAQMGVETGALVEPDPGLLLDLRQKTFNVWYVPEAAGSPHVPAQEEFVLRHRIRSVIGFGGQIVPGGIFAVIAFSRSFIPRETADLFQTLALNLRVALVPFARDRVFA